MLVDPQLYNRYAYVRNNPLRFVDPKGETIELLGSKEERRNALELLRQAVGEEAGSYLYQRTRTDKEGGLCYTVEIMEKAPNLLGMKGVAAAVARLISSDNLATIEFAQPGTKVVGLWGEKGSVGPIGMLGASPGVTSTTGSHARTWLLDPSQDYGSLPGSVMINGRPDKLDPAITLAHELGHMAFAWAQSMGPSCRRSP